MPETLIAANWKMNTTLEEATELVSQMKAGLQAVGGVRTVLCPPFVSLAAVGSAVDGTRIALGAQNMHPEAGGAFTGEVSAAMLAGLCEFVILGHSDRRNLLGEDDAFINRKVVAALGAGLRPILCVGERLDIREAGRADAFVEGQVRAALDGVADLDSLAIAYEPIWAIGTGKAASPQDAQDVMAHIRQTVSSLYGAGEAAGVPILYGGSVTADNVADFIRREDVNGALVGGASLKAGGFVDLVRNAAGAVSG